jgi:hypothetical protein
VSGIAYDLTTSSTNPSGPPRHGDRALHELQEQHHDDR